MLVFIKKHVYYMIIICCSLVIIAEQKAIQRSKKRMLQKHLPPRFHNSKTEFFVYNHPVKSRYSEEQRTKVLQPQYEIFAEDEDQGSFPALDNDLKIRDLMEEIVIRSRAEGNEVYKAEIRPIIGVLTKKNITVSGYEHENVTGEDSEESIRTENVPIYFTTPQDTNTAWLVLLHKYLKESQEKSDDEELSERFETFKEADTTVEMLDADIERNDTKNMINNAKNDNEDSKETSTELEKIEKYFNSKETENHMVEEITEPPKIVSTLRPSISYVYPVYGYKQLPYKIKNKSSESDKDITEKPTILYVYSVQANKAEVEETASTEGTLKYEESHSEEKVIENKSEEQNQALDHSENNLTEQPLDSYHITAEHNDNNTTHTSLHQADSHLLHELHNFSNSLQGSLNSFQEFKADAGFKKPNPEDINDSKFIIQDKHQSTIAETYHQSYTNKNEVHSLSNKFQTMLSKPYSTQVVVPFKQPFDYEENTEESIYLPFNTSEILLGKITEQEKFAAVKAASSAGSSQINKQSQPHLQQHGEKHLHSQPVPQLNTYSQPQIKPQIHSHIQSEIKPQLSPHSQIMPIVLPQMQQQLRPIILDHLSEISQSDTSLDQNYNVVQKLSNPAVIIKTELDNMQLNKQLEFLQKNAPNIKNYEDVLERNKKPFNERTEGEFKSSIMNQTSKDETLAPVPKSEFLETDSTKANLNITTESSIDKASLSANPAHSSSTSTESIKSANNTTLNQKEGFNTQTTNTSITPANEMDSNKIKKFETENPFTIKGSNSSKNSTELPQTLLLNHTTNSSSDNMALQTTIVSTTEHTSINVGFQLETTNKIQNRNSADDKTLAIKDGIFTNLTDTTKSNQTLPLHLLESIAKITSSSQNQTEKPTAEKTHSRVNTKYQAMMNMKPQIMYTASLSGITTASLATVANSANVQDRLSAIANIPMMTSTPIATEKLNEVLDSPISSSAIVTESLLNVDGSTSIVQYRLPITADTLLVISDSSTDLAVASSTTEIEGPLMIGTTSLPVTADSLHSIENVIVSPNKFTILQPVGDSTTASVKKSPIDAVPPITSIPPIEPLSKESKVQSALTHLATPVTVLPEIATESSLAATLSLAIVEDSPTIVKDLTSDIAVPNLITAESQKEAANPLSNKLDLLTKIKDLLTNVSHSLTVVEKPSSLEADLVSVIRDWVIDNVTLPTDFTDPLTKLSDSARIEVLPVTLAINTKGALDTRKNLNELLTNVSNITDDVSDLSKSVLPSIIKDSSLNLSDPIIIAGNLSILPLVVKNSTAIVKNSPAIVADSPSIVIDSPKNETLLSTILKNSAKDVTDSSTIVRDSPSIVIGSPKNEALLSTIVKNSAKDVTGSSTIVKELSDDVIDLSTILIDSPKEAADPPSIVIVSPKNATDSSTNVKDAHASVTDLPLIIADISEELTESSTIIIESSSALETLLSDTNDSVKDRYKASPATVETDSSLVLLELASPADEKDSLTVTTKIVSDIPTAVTDSIANENDSTPSLINVEKLDSRLSENPTLSLSDSIKSSWHSSSFLANVSTISIDAPIIVIDSPKIVTDSPKIVTDSPKIVTDFPTAIAETPTAVEVSHSDTKNSPTIMEDIGNGYKATVQTDSPAALVEAALLTVKKDPLAISATYEVEVTKTVADLPPIIDDLSLIAEDLSAAQKEKKKDSSMATETKKDSGLPFSANDAADSTKNPETSTVFDGSITSPSASIYLASATVAVKPYFHEANTLDPQGTSVSVAYIPSSQIEVPEKSVKEEQAEFGEESFYNTIPPVNIPDKSKEKLYEKLTTVAESSTHVVDVLDPKITDSTDSIKTVEAPPQISSVEQLSIAEAPLIINENIQSIEIDHLSSLNTDGLANEKESSTLKGLPTFNETLITNETLVTEMVLKAVNESATAVQKDQGSIKANQFLYQTDSSLNNNDPLSKETQTPSIDPMLFKLNSTASAEKESLETLFFNKPHENSLPITKNCSQEVCSNNTANDLQETSSPLFNKIFPNLVNNTTPQDPFTESLKSTLILENSLQNLKNNTQHLESTHNSFATLPPAPGDTPFSTEWPTETHTKNPTDTSTEIPIESTTEYIDSLEYLELVIGNFIRHQMENIESLTLDEHEDETTPPAQINHEHISSQNENENETNKKTSNQTYIGEEVSMSVKCFTLVEKHDDDDDNIELSTEHSSTSINTVSNAVPVKKQIMELCNKSGSNSNINNETQMLIDNTKIKNNNNNSNNTRKLSKQDMSKHTKSDEINDSSNSKDTINNINSSNINKILPIEKELHSLELDKIKLNYTKTLKDNDFVSEETAVDNVQDKSNSASVETNMNNNDETEGAAVMVDTEQLHHVAGGTMYLSQTDAETNFDKLKDKHTMLEKPNSATNDDYDNDDDNLTNAATFSSDTTQYSNSNKQIFSDAEITTTNWWRTLPYAEIRRFLNTIFDDAAQDLYEEITRKSKEMVSGQLEDDVEHLQEKEGQAIQTN